MRSWLGSEIRILWRNCATSASRPVKRSSPSHWWVDYRPEHLFTLRQSLAAYRNYQKMINDCDHEIRQRLEEFNPPRQPETSDGDDHKPTLKTPSPDGVLRSELKRAFGIDLTKVPGIRSGTVCPGERRGTICSAMCHAPAPPSEKQPRASQMP